jgi:hypothetical protein
MRQLVVDDVTELAVLPLEGEDDAVLEKLRDPPIPSSRYSLTTFVCWKSLCELYTMMGTRFTSW